MDPETVIVSLRSSGRAAATRGLYEHAEHQFRRAIELNRTAGGPEADRLDVELHLGLGESVARREGFGSPAAFAAFAKASRAPASTTDDHTTVGTLSGLAGYATATGDFNTAWSIAQRLIVIGGAGPDVRAGMQGHLLAGATDYFRGRLRSADTYLSAAIELCEALKPAERSADSLAEAHAVVVSVLADVRAMRGRMDEALGLARTATEIAAGHERSIAEIMAYAHAAVVAGLAERFEECNQHAKRAALASQGNMWLFAGVANALVAWSEGRLHPGADNVERLRVARAQVEASGSTVTIIHPAGLEGDLLILSGQVEQAAEVLRAGIEAATKIGHLAGVPDLYRLLAVALNESGVRSSAQDALKQGMILARAQEARLFSSRGLRTAELLGLSV